LVKSITQFVSNQHKYGLFIWLISNQPAVVLSEQTITNNQSAVLLSQNKPATSQTTSSSNDTESQTSKIFCIYSLQVRNIGGSIREIYAQYEKIADEFEFVFSFQKYVPLPNSKKNQGRK
jgi:hypothetical protein